MTDQAPILIGIDPGFAITGYAVLDCSQREPTIITYGVITTKAEELFPNRLQKLHVQLTKLLTTYKPYTIAIEQLFFAKNTTTAINVGHARGVIVLAAAQQNIPIVEYTPLQIKQATTSYGRAEKKQMQRMMQHIFKMEHLPTPDDAADALAIAWLASQQYRPTS